MSPDEAFVAGITPDILRRKWMQGLQASLNELTLVYKRHARSYYVKNGKVTREAELVEEVTTLVGQKHGDDNAE